MISLVMIARDEARCLARCLRSAAPHVDEMLVVDTGSTDGTQDIARAQGARVLAFTWCDDFSAARNFALEQAQGDWRLVLDADEWIEEGGAALRNRLQAAAPEFVGQVTIRSAFDDGAVLRHAASRVSRVLPRGVTYAGRVHEQPQHRLPVQALDLVIGHDGYRQEHQARKAGRNEQLLRAALAQRPGDAYLHYQLGKDLEIQARFDEAADAYGRARSAAGWPPVDAAGAAALQSRLPWLHDMAARRVYCLKQARRFEEGLREIGAEGGFWTHSPDFHFAVGDLLLDCALAEPARAAELLPRMEAAWQHCLALGEAPALEGAVEGRGSYLAAHNLAVYYELVGEQEKARLHRAQARPGGA